MHTLNLAAVGPLSFTLAADARLTSTNYTDDQIWELNLGGGEPAALAVQTTYGLRAHWMRLFPRFVRGESARVDPASFHTPPRITHYFPNYLSLTFEPFDGLEVIAEYWASESQIMQGHLCLANHSILPQNFRLEWVALLNPIDRQGGMASVQVGPSHVLSGETAYLCPVVFMTGGPQPYNSPYPALAVDMELYPGNSRQLSWAAAAQRSYEASLDAARAATARPWEAEQARIELFNYSHTLQIETGNPDWDTALALTQIITSELLVKNPDYLPNPSFVLNRLPDQGFSVRQDGGDYPYLWNGQTALDSYYLTSLLLPGAPELAAGLLRNFIAVQEESGAIDWKPGLGGQRSRRLAQPLLASMAVGIAPYMSAPYMASPYMAPPGAAAPTAAPPNPVGVDWYREVFPPLLRFFNHWFDTRYDQDGDSFPEWQHPLQSGLEDSPIFDRWSPGAQGIDITRLESPALAAMLLRECTALIEMATRLAETEQASAAYARLSSAIEGSERALEEHRAQSSGAAETLEALNQRKETLQRVLAETWDDKAKTYRYRDYATHLSPSGSQIMEFSGAGRGTSRKRFGHPSRLVIQLKVHEERTYAVTVTLHGFTAEGEITETIEPRGFTWAGMQARATTQNTFLAVKRAEVVGLGEEDLVRVSTANYTQEDCSLLLPLWAGAPTAEQARQLVEEVIETRYLQEFGIPTCPPDQQVQEELPGFHSALSSALLPWNHLIGEGLLRYGYREQAASLVTRLMNGIVGSLKTNLAFRQYYHAETGLAAGERGHLHGLAPLGLFLRTLGIEFLGAREIILNGFNPFSTPINVQYRKVKLSFYTDRTEVVFPGGQKVTVDQPGLHRITLS